MAKSKKQRRRGSGLTGSPYHKQAVAKLRSQRNVDAATRESRDQERASQFLEQLRLLTDPQDQRLASRYLDTIRSIQRLRAQSSWATGVERRAMDSKLSTALDAAKTERQMLDLRLARLNEDQTDGALLRSNATPLRWRILPPGTGTHRTLTGEQVQSMTLHASRLERLQFLDRLRPEAWYEGSDLGGVVYYVAVFRDVVLADCPEWGNALYYCDRNDDGWMTTLQKDKQAAVAAGAKRIIHAGEWRDRVRQLIEY